MRRVLLAALAAALVLPSAAGAHATLMASTPAEQGRVHDPPTEIRLVFDQSVTAPHDAIVVLAADGRRVSGPVGPLARGTVIRAPVEGLAVGEAYTVRWRELSADGHIGTGVFTAAGQLRVSQFGGNTFVEMNVDSNLSTNEGVLQLLGEIDLAAADFVV